MLPFGFTRLLLLNSVIGSSPAGGCPSLRRVRRPRAVATPSMVMALAISATVLAAVFTAPLPARASVTFYTDEAAWTAAVDAVAVDSLDTVATNVALADEVGSAPIQDEQLGPQLTFRASNTGLCGSFTLRAIQPGAGLTYDDGEPSPASFPTGTLSVGDIDDFEDDDFRITFPTASIHAVGFFLVNNTQAASEGFTAFGPGGVVGSLAGSSIPDSSGNASTFVGVVASEPLNGVRFDEDAAADDIAIRDFRLGCAAEDPDADSLSNLAEQRAGTDPGDPDTDADGLLDGAEVGSGSFGAEQLVSTLADAAQSVVVADVDGDGDTDVVSGDQFGDQVAWFENTDGAGGFGALQVISSLTDSAKSVFVVDVDGDGDPDVLSASLFDDKIAWYENTDGAGTFGVQQVISTLADGAQSVFAADVDGDGDPDVLSASQLDDKIAWYENTDGAGGFGGQQLVSTLADSAHSVFAADVDGDGDTDVLSASAGDHKIAWYENTDGLGTFGPQLVISTLANAARSVFAADVDGDGDVDVLSASLFEDKIAWYENTDGLGAFGPQQVISTLADDAQSVFAADVDGDGDTDVLSASSADNEIAWYENTDGTGSFGPQQVLSTTAAFARSVFAADVDGDGDADVLSASASDDKIAWYEQLDLTDPLDPDSDDDGLLDGFEVANGFDPLVPGEQDEDTDSDGLLNLVEQSVGTDPLDPDSDDDGLLDGEEIGTGSFGAQQVISTLADAPWSVFAADVDGDGDPDVLSASQFDDEIAWYENTDGKGTFGTQQLISSLADGALSVFAADVDGDGDVDALSASEADDKIAWYENTDGAGTFGTQQVISSLAESARSVFAADVDGDGDTDVLSASRDDDEIAWYENLDGLGGFGAGQVISTLADGPLSVFAADLDGDGDTDVLSASQFDDEIAWYENIDGSGTFGAQQVISTVADSARSVFAADVDGDGSLDVLSASSLDDKLAWYENTTGVGTFGPQQVISTLADVAISVFAADVDGDGDTDVLSASIFDGKIAWYENTNGAGSFGAQQVISTLANGARSVFAADVDGDGDMDALSASVGDDKIAWYEQLNLADPLDPDTDDDGLLDGVETNTGVFVSASDTGSDPLDPDTDDDGLSDGTEVAAGTDPNNPLPPASTVPAIGRWGLGVLMGLLMAFGVSRQRRRWA